MAKPLKTLFLTLCGVGAMYSAITPALAADTSQPVCSGRCVMPSFIDPIEGTTIAGQTGKICTTPGKGDKNCCYRFTSKVKGGIGGICIPYASSIHVH